MELLDNSKTKNKKNITRDKDSEKEPLKIYFNNEEEKTDDLISMKIESDTSFFDKMKKAKDFFLFKVHLSIILSLIYFICFILSIPKSPTKLGEEKDINIFINSNITSNLNILINNFSFIFPDNTNHSVENVSEKNDTKFYGQLLEFNTDKIYLFRWLIGFLYFVIRIFCFIFSNEEFKSKLFDKNNLPFIQNIANLFFPIWLFFYDLKHNISYINIKTEDYNGKTINYFIETKKKFSMIDYIEVFVPNIFYFLISLVYKGIEQLFWKYISKGKKIMKLT